jgi:DNA-binding NarL/FixJ family response regulator
MSVETNMNNISSIEGVAQVDAMPQESLIAFARNEQLPVQLEHWLRKRHIGMKVSESSSVDPMEIRASGARYVLIDFDAYCGGNVGALRALKSELHDVRIIVTTARSDAAFVDSLSDAGATGVVVKRPYVADLGLAIHAASEGRGFVTGQAGQREGASVQITARERQVLELMANGYSNQAIGEKLSISVKTVEAHRARLFKKLGASNVADAVLLAIRVGLVTP